MPTRDVRLSALAVAQPRAVHHLTQALRHKRLPHGILVVGPPSTGVLAVCQALTYSLVCAGLSRTDVDACGVCAPCQSYGRGTLGEVQAVAASDRGTISVDQVRTGSKKLGLRPAQGRINILRINDAQGMLKGAQNALLKTLEEPPGQSCIIMGATSVGLLLPTLLSRVVRVTLQPADKQVSLQAMAAAGIDAPYAAWLAPQVGAQGEQAQAMMDDGFVAVADALREALTLGLSAPKCQSLAQTLGQNPKHFDMVLGLLELMLRDALATLGSAPQEMLTQPGVANVLTQLPGSRISAGIDRLMLLRRRRRLNINRSQALEGLFVTLNHRGAV